MRLPQFTTKRLLTGITIIILSFALFNFGLRTDKAAPAYWSAPLSAFSIPLLGTGIGFIFDRPFLGAAVSLALTIGWTAFAVAFLMD